MVRIGNDILNYANVCHEASQEWNKIKNKGTEEINNIIRKYLTIQFNLYDI